MSPVSPIFHIVSTVNSGDSRGNPAQQLTRFSFRLFIFSDENSDEIILKFKKIIFELFVL